LKNLFYQPLKITAKDPDVLFWGCLHYGHDPKWETPIWAKRGFSSSADHDAGIVERWNARATDRTTGFLLGDTMFGFGGEEKFQRLIERLQFSTLYIMAGNHTAGWKQTFENCEGNTMPLAGKTVIFVPNYLEAFINGQPVVMSHYPLASWNGQGKGSWMIHSHCHGSLYDTELGKLLYRAKIIDVGVERCPWPVTFGGLRSLFRKNSVSFDHHHEGTSTPFSNDTIA
jgi:calcineurin-like phosphoesterase family protein